jgi:son of sevenless-like protein
MNNFSSSLAIAAGLQTVAIARLNITWSAINNTAKEKLDKINHVASRDKNFNALRHALREVNPPCVPYLGMFLTDLTFIEEGGSDWSHSNLIRWKKCKRVSSVLREMLVYQYVAHCLVVRWNS